MRYDFQVLKHFRSCISLSIILFLRDSRKTCSSLEKKNCYKLQMTYLLLLGAERLGYLGLRGALKVLGRLNITDVRIFLVRVPLSPLMTCKTKSN